MNIHSNPHIFDSHQQMQVQIAVFFKEERQMFGAWEEQGILHEIPVRLRRKWQQFAQRPDTFRTSDIKIAGGGAGFGMSEISAMRIEGFPTAAV